MIKARNTKRKVDLISSHSDNSNEDGPGLMCSEEGPAASDLYQQQRRLGVRPDERVVEYEEFIPEPEVKYPE